MRVAVEQVLQTATKVLENQLTAREATTILATLTRQAVSSGRELRETDPERADTYRELLLVIGRELRHREAESVEARHLHAVIDDLATVLRALE